MNQRTNQPTPCRRVLLQKSFGQSRRCSHFPEPEVSYRHSQHTATCPSPEPGQSSPRPPPQPPLYMFTIHINIILPSTSRCSNWSLSFRCPHKNPVCIYPLPTRATRPFHFSWRRNDTKAKTNSFHNMWCSLPPLPIRNSVVSKNADGQLNTYCI
jgi:hypothetical protein